MFARWRYRKRCHAAARLCQHPNVATYIREYAGLGVDKLSNTPLIAVDLEMTGLDATQNHIIAIGWTQLDHGRINLASNRHLLINAEQSVGHSAAIHELTDNEVAEGMPLEAGLAVLFEAARGRVWLFHHADLDVAFLQQACLAWTDVAMPFMVLDTMCLELTLRKRRELPVHHGDLQLTRLRRNYNLPAYTAHNALIDAYATAELLLALAENMDTSGSLRLKPHLKYY
ncbi:MAG: 3'-5' exonuclease [Xanthomonadales bacterium]|nr:3'-5' exonuclease [Xanthomonadales bacterium]